MQNVSRILSPCHILSLAQVCCRIISSPSCLQGFVSFFWICRNHAQWFQMQKNPFIMHIDLQACKQQNVNSHTSCFSTSLYNSESSAVIPNAGKTPFCSGWSSHPQTTNDMSSCINIFLHVTWFFCRSCFQDHQHHTQNIRNAFQTMAFCSPFVVQIECPFPGSLDSCCCPLMLEGRTLSKLSFQVAIQFKAGTNEHQFHTTGCFFTLLLLQTAAW